MRPAIFVIVLALALTSFALVSNASPVPAGIKRDRAKMILDNLSQVMKQSSDALAQVQQATKRLMQTHGAPVGSFSTDRPNRKLQQDVQPCPGSSTALCTAPSQVVSACFLAVFNQPNMNSMGSLFGLPTFLCQLSTSNSSCAATLINYVKTCTCIDYQPIFNLVCPTAPSASACSKNTYVQQFIALQTNSSFGFFGNAAMNMGVLFDGFGKQPDLTMCGDPEVYRTTMLINNIGACLYDIVNAFPMPSFTTLPGGINYRQMMTGSLKCALTMPSYRLQSLCSGNVAKCYSALQAPSSNLGSCGTLSAGTCPAGCSTQLATFGATASTSPASCCVKWFQNMAGAPSCSTTPSLTMSNMMGPECTDFMQLASSACQPSAGNTCPTPAMLSQYMNFPMFPAACSAKTPPSLAVAACAVSTTGLTAACADSSTPYVQSSLFAPLKTTTATLSFTSAGLSAVLKQKYAETLTAVASAMQSQLGPNVIIVPISVTVSQGRRLLQANTFTAILSVTSTSMAGSSYNPQTTVAAIQPANLQTALTSQLQAQVAPSLSASVASAPSASTVQNAPTPQSLPAAQSTPPVVSPASASLVLLQLLLICIALVV